MFGKVIAFGTYFHQALNVYQIRRFPSTKLPLFSINLTLLLSTLIAHRVYWNIKLKSLECECSKRKENKNTEKNK